MDISLSLFDDSYVWTTPHFTSELLSKKEAIALGHWKFKIKRDEIEFLMRGLDKNYNTIYLLGEDETL